jgi:D-beta-D-heptose 7-phosphate kinase/D-beta-D-heptose 1-phosphate adenosyltransferase
MLENREPCRILEDGLGHLRILVVGDLILDQTFMGTVERISPEAPIPVVKIESMTNGLGGACNVTHNLSRLGCKTMVAGVTGADHDARLLKTMLEEKGIETGFLVELERPTTKKIRVVSARQQMLRMDFEKTTPISSCEEKQVMLKIEAALAEGVDAVVLSDYGKGVCTSGLCRGVIGLCRARELPVIVDPKGTDWSRYAGCTLVTPNMKELGQAAHRIVPNEDRAVEQAARELRERFCLEDILVTRSDLGISLLSAGGVLVERAQAREVYDVSGAGDTIVAVMAAFISAGATLEDAARTANRAAGFVVAKAGTYAIGKEELLREMREAGPSATLGKIKTLEEAASIVTGWKAEGKKVVFTNGCFDILHAGHLYCLERAKDLGDRLVVGLNSDTSIRLLKGAGRPVNRQDFRTMLLAALSPVDLVVVFEEETPLDVIKALRPDYIVKGGDYKLEEIVGAREIASWGGEVVIIQRIAGLSSTGILQSTRPQVEKPSA